METVLTYYNKSLINKSTQWMFKRLFEITVTILGIVLLLPVFFLTALVIKLDSRGPVLFKQKRVGHCGKEFYMYKFRSMEVGAEEKLDSLREYNETNKYMFKMTDDPRVTRVGKYLRKYSLDEFPQLINVLKGEMCLVGFRPPTLSEVEGYEDWHHIRFACMPGLTGPWQVRRSEILDFDKVVELENEYIENWSLKKDFEILLKTVCVVLRGGGK